MYEYCSGIPTVGFTKTMKTYVRTAISRIVISIRYLPIASLATYHYNNVTVGKAINWNPGMHWVPSPTRVWMGLVGVEVKFTHLAAQEFVCRPFGEEVKKPVVWWVRLLSEQTADRRRRTRYGLNLAVTPRCSQWADFFLPSISKRIRSDTPLSHE